MAMITELATTATAIATSAWREGLEQVDFSDHIHQIPRTTGLPDIELSEIRTVVRTAMEKFGSARTSSDAWLAPRLHAALRLTRQEAARRGVWRYLAMVELADYVRWRFGADDGDPHKVAPAVRFHGDHAKHALARLWWGAEQFRDGADYTPAEKAFRNQDLMNNLLKMDISHHRPTCQAAVRVLFPEDGEPLSGDKANALAKAANATATTLLIDALAPDAPLDPDERVHWAREPIDALKLAEDSLPAGPDDPSVPVTSVAVMTDLFAQLVDEAPLRPSRRREAPVGASAGGQV